MKATILGLIIVGIIAALSAAVLTATLRAEARSEGSGGAESPRTIEIIVAAHDLEPMTTIDADAVLRKSVREDEAPEGALTNTVQVIGQIVGTKTRKGQPVLRRSLARDHAGMHLAMTLPDGGRAMSLMLPQDSGILGVLYPGCFVDVMASFRVPGIRGGVSGEIVSATLIQGVRMLAVGDESVVHSGEEIDDAPTEDNSQRRRRVTLLVDPKQAEALQLAINHGQVSLALRNPLDEAETDGQGMLLSDLSAEIAQRLAQLTTPDMGSTPVTLAVEPSASPPDQAADGPSPGASPSPPGDVPAAGDARPKWTTVVLRGRSVEEVSFALQEENEKAAPGAPGDE